MPGKTVISQLIDIVGVEDIGTTPGDNKYARSFVGLSKAITDVKGYDADASTDPTVCGVSKAVVAVAAQLGTAAITSTPTAQATGLVKKVDDVATFVGNVKGDETTSTKASRDVTGISKAVVDVATQLGTAATTSPTATATGLVKKVDDAATNLGKVNTNIINTTTYEMDMLDIIYDALSKIISKLNIGATGEAIINILAKPTNRTNATAL